MEPGEKLTIDDVVTVLRTWTANRMHGKVTVHVQDGGIVGLRPAPYLQTATQLRRHLPEVKQAP